MRQRSSRSASSTSLPMNIFRLEGEPARAMSIHPHTIKCATPDKYCRRADRCPIVCLDLSPSSAGVHIEEESRLTTFNAHNHACSTQLILITHLTHSVIVDVLVLIMDYHITDIFSFGFSFHFLGQ